LPKQNSFSQKNIYIGRYAATSAYIHVRIPLKITTVFNTEEAISEVYSKLLNQHEDPFKPITKSVTDVSLSMIKSLLEDFCNLIKALPHKVEISTPRWPKRFIAIGISIAAMTMSTFNTIRIKQLNDEISTLEEKTDGILDMVQLHCPQEDSNIGKLKTPQKKGRDKSE
jgi:hypothetical protein